MTDFTERSCKKTKGSARETLAVRVIAAHEELSPPTKVGNEDG